MIEKLILSKTESRKNAEINASPDGNPLSYQELNERIRQAALAAETSSG